MSGESGKTGGVLHALGVVASPHRALLLAPLQVSSPLLVIYGGGLVYTYGREGRMAANRALHMKRN